MSVPPAAAAERLGGPALPRSVHAGYGVGAVATHVFSTVPSLLLLIYLTDALAVAPALAGFVVVAPKAVDIVASPYIGMRSDRTVSRWGPRRPWMLAGTAALPVCFALLFAGLPLQGAPAALYVLVVFTAAALAASVFQVPYAAMPGEITDGYHERSALQGWRTVFVGVALLLGGALAPVLVDSTGPGRAIEGYRLMGVVMAAVVLAAMAACVYGTRSAPLRRRVGRTRGLADQFRSALGNPHFRRLLPTAFLQVVSSGTMIAGVPYVTGHVMGEPGYTALLVVCVTVPLIATMPLWTAVSRRLDKRPTLALAGAFFIAGAIGLYFIPVMGGLPWAIAMSVVVGTGNAGCTMLPYSMLTDCIAATRAVSGRHQAGVLAGIWSSMEALGAALGAQLLSAALAVSGYRQSAAGEAVEQTDRALQGMLIGSTLVPAAVMLGSVLLLRLYRLDAAEMARLTAADA
ncbi:MFS transporter [Nocardiopsis halophila]|uniref:MFS transporter n=1 Tax=Nocardiopsis halophila TaxID=141692 RepID=UPI00034D6F47|nr:MFS transporter [Nocardiopsis halophila]